MSDNLVQRTAWWVVPGSPEHVLAYLSAHRAPGTVVSGSAEAGGGTSLMGVMFDAAGAQWRRPATYSGLGQVMSATATGTRTALRVDAQATWLPPLSTAGRIPDSVFSVEVVERRIDGSVAFRRTGGAHAARALAAVVNGLPVAESGKSSCPNDDGGVDVLTFHLVHRSITVTADVPGCGQVTVGRPGPGNPARTGGGELHRALERALTR
jgi:hypothetical protein